MNYKLPLGLEGGHIVTASGVGDSVADALNNVKDALAAVVELYEDLGCPPPRSTWLLRLR